MSLFSVHLASRRFTEFSHSPTLLWGRHFRAMAGASYGVTEVRSLTVDLNRQFERLTRDYTDPPAAADYRLQDIDKSVTEIGHRKRVIQCGQAEATHRLGVINDLEAETPHRHKVIEDLAAEAEHRLTVIDEVASEAAHRLDVTQELDQFATQRLELLQEVTAERHETSARLARIEQEVDANHLLRWWIRRRLTEREP